VARNPFKHPNSKYNNTKTFFIQLLMPLDVRNINSNNTPNQPPPPPKNKEGIPNVRCTKTVDNDDSEGEKSK
jgi:hypothetical protein